MSKRKRLRNKKQRKVYPKENLQAKEQKDKHFNENAQDGNYLQNETESQLKPESAEWASMERTVPFAQNTDNSFGDGESENRMFDSRNEQEEPKDENEENEENEEKDNDDDEKLSKADFTEQTQRKFYLAGYENVNINRNPDNNDKAMQKEDSSSFLKEPKEQGEKNDKKEKENPKEQENKYNLKAKPKNVKNKAKKESIKHREAFSSTYEGTKNTYGSVMEAAVEKDYARDRKKEFEMRVRAIPRKASQLWQEYRKDAKIHVKSGATGFALGIFAYLLGACKLMFGVSPLGIALLCASPKKILWIFAGLFTSALSFEQSTFIYIFAYATGVAVRILSRLLIDVPDDRNTENIKEISEEKDKSKEIPKQSKSAKGVIEEVKFRASAIFTESIYLRMATSCACAFIVGLFNLISNRFQYYDLFGAIFALAFTPLATFVYSGCFEENKTDKRFRQVALGAFLVSLAYAMKDMYLIGISMGAFFSFFVTLYCCRQKGLFKGSVLGLLCGLAYSPKYAPMFAISGLTCGALWNFSPFGALCAGGASAMMWGFYIEGVQAMSRLFPSIMLSSVCYLFASKTTIFPMAKDLIFSGKYCSDMNELEIAKESRKDAYKGLVRLSQSFEDLSALFYELSDTVARPDLESFHIVCDNVCDRYCKDCKNKSLCWSDEYAESKETLMSISEKLYQQNMAASSDFPSYLRKRCIALPMIISQINSECNSLCEKVRLANRSDIFALDYKVVSELIAASESDNRVEYKKDDFLTLKASEILSQYGFNISSVSVYGERRKKIIAKGFDIHFGGVAVNELKKSLERALKMPLSDPVIEMKENSLSLKMASKRKFSLKISMKTAKGTEDTCGDTISTFESTDDRYYALISDGMGSGDRAAFTSGLCSVFLEKLLSKGNRSAQTLKLLNTFVKTKPYECSCTLDLMEFDMLTGHSEFVKCSASATYVRRNNEIIKLSACTLPLGILDEIDSCTLSFDTKKGDEIIMMSDGITGGDDDSMWFTELITKGWEENHNIMIRKLIESAKEHGSKDDISVMIITVR